MLGEAAEAATGGRLAWLAENDTDARKVLGARYPGLPCYDDIKTMPWEYMIPANVLIGGIPCQPASSAGKQKGVNDDRWLWPYVAGGIRRMRKPPSVIFLENVPNLIRVSGGQALAEVLGDLAAFGYVGAYGVYSAAEAGAPHLRKRWFLLAVHPRGDWHAVLAAAQDAHRAAGLERGTPAALEAEGGRPRPDAGGRSSVPASDSGGPGDRLILLPTPTAREGKGAVVPIGRPRSDGRVRGAGDAALSDVIIGLALAGNRTLLPTPLNGEARHGLPGQHRTRGDTMLTGEILKLVPEGSLEEACQLDRWDWREYGPAISLWKAVSDTPVPAPAEPGMRGQPRLNAEFAAWMMGMPPGWVTGLSGLSRSAQLRIIGNSVVRHQAFMAWHALVPAVIDALGIANA